MSKYILFCLILVFLLLNGCSEEKGDINFATLRVKNSTSNNDIYILTNILMVEYNPATMATIKNNLGSTTVATKATAMKTFATDNTIFRWNGDDSSLNVKYSQSYSLNVFDCNKSYLVRIINAQTNDLATSDSEYLKKFYYGFFNPLECGYSYTLNINNP